MNFIPETEVRLLSAVPLNNTYEHQRTFKDKGEQEAYFKSKTASGNTFTNFTYVKETGTVKVPKARDKLYNCNYLMFKNKNFSGKYFYAFITKLTYINPNMTEIEFELDVWQTWQFDIDFKPSFIDREHTRRWNADGSPVINTVDEGLNYGSEYDTVYTKNIVPNGGYKWLVIVSKEALHTSERAVKPTVIGTPQPLSYYITPFKDNDMTPNVILPQDGDYPISPPTRVMEELYKDTDAVNNIVSLYVTDYTGIRCTYQAGNAGSPDFLTFPTDSSVKLSSVVIADGVYTLHVEKATKFDPYGEEVNSDKYEGFEPVTESKLLMYPYTVTVLDDFRGNRVEFKNEYIKDKNLRLTGKGSLGLSNKTSWGILGYNYEGEDNALMPSSNEHALINNNPSDLPIVNEFLAAYLQGNRNSLETQKASIMFNGILGGSSAITGAVGGAMVGGPAGAVVGGAIGIGSQVGNTYFQIKELESKVEDIKNTPPNISKMGSNTAYDYGNGYNGIWVIKKQIKPEYRKKLTDFFKMFGYKVNEVKKPNLKSRAHFNFIRTIGANITGNIPADDLTKIMSMFNNGVTLWHVDDIGNYNLSNGEV